MLQLSLLIFLIYCAKLPTAWWCVFVAAAVFDVGFKLSMTGIVNVPALKSKVLAAARKVLGKYKKYE